MKPVALGLKARTGRAVFVALAGTAEEPCFAGRGEMRLLPEGAFAPYHVAAELDTAAARTESVAASIAVAHELALSGVRDAIAQLAGEGHRVRGCGVLVGPGMPDWTTEQIVAVHVRMHQAEGELFRHVLVEAARACGLAPATLREKSAMEDAAQALQMSPPQLAAQLAALGHVAGAPWGKDQKEAAAAAWVALRLGWATRSTA